MSIDFQVPQSIEAKCELLRKELAPHRTVAIAYSGGVDSTFLAWYVQHQLGIKAYALLVVTPFLSRRELEDAVRVAHELVLSLEQIVADPSSVSLIRKNPVDRCYYCKREVMMRIIKRSQELGCSAVLDGTHAGDREGHRPGRKALRELGILSPLALAGLEKSEIRELSRLANLPTWNKPSQSCLATRLPYGTELTHEVLHRIEQAEQLLWDLGCEQVRVRSDGQTARIEVNTDAFQLILDPEARAKIIARFRTLGFLHVTLDLAGFRSGSWDEHQNEPENLRRIS